MRKIFSIVLITLAVSVLYYRDDFYYIANNLMDRFTEKTREVDFDIKILTIDDESLEQIGQWPWSRDIIANLSRLLVEEGARAVFVDTLYSEPSANFEADEVWQEVLNEHSNIYLPLSFHFEPLQTTGEGIAYTHINRPIYSLPLEQIGHINAWEEQDRVIRKALLGVRDENDEMIPAMSVRLANVMLPDDQQVSWNEQNEWFIGEEKIKTGPFGEVNFSYASKPTEPKFDMFSIHRVISGEIDPAYFEDAVVLIGPYTVGMQDRYPVPNSHSQMFGVEIHANIVQSLIDGKLYSSVSKGTGIFIIGLTVLLAFFSVEYVNAKWAFIPFIILFITYFISFKLFYTGQHLIIPLFYPVLAIIIVYIVSIISQYVKERIEKNRVTSLFGRYVAKNVVSEILASKEEVKLGGERKDVTLLFIDIRGFTPLSEKMEPEEVIQMLNEYLDLCSQCIFQYEGTVDKFMGDGIMVIFGAPIPQVDHAERAIKAALLMKEKSDELAARLMKKYGRSVNFGMGINSGPAVIGNIGSKERLDYTAIGDTVNLAARLEANAKPGQILISEETYNRVKDTFAASRLEPIKVKGKEQLILIYEVEEEINDGAV